MRKDGLGLIRAKKVYYLFLWLVRLKQNCKTNDGGVYAPWPKRRFGSFRMETHHPQPHAKSKGSGTYHGTFLVHTLESHSSHGLEAMKQP